MMSRTARHRKAKLRQKFYRIAAQRTDKRGGMVQKFYSDQLAKAERDMVRLLGASDPLPSPPVQPRAER